MRLGIEAASSNSAARTQVAAEPIPRVAFPKGLSYNLAKLRG